MPREVLLCANANCWFARNQDPTYGGYCCRKCFWRSLQPGKSKNSKKKHGPNCSKVWAPDGVARAPKVVPEGEEVPSGAEEDNEDEASQEPEEPVRNGRQAAPPGWAGQNRQPPPQPHPVARRQTQEARMPQQAQARNSRPVHMSPGGSSQRPAGQARSGAGHPACRHGEHCQGNPWDALLQHMHDSEDGDTYCSHCVSTILLTYPDFKFQEVVPREAPGDDEDSDEAEGHPRCRSRDQCLGNPMDAIYHHIWDGAIRDTFCNSCRMYFLNCDDLEDLQFRRIHEDEEPAAKRPRQR
eukprot:TRINITY_DN29277_c0_g1_i1.p1 TRINITY_DN29277_c0_g1~~TRINITY_DN29277_c0_g1_i1.p1  ORF type:complete len:297 (-),score=42.56 TRINITY_DN29277_c0_g1_i1:365-1255(-)